MLPPRYHSTNTIRTEVGKVGAIRKYGNLINPKQDLKVSTAKMGGVGEAEGEGEGGGEREGESK